MSDLFQDLSSRARDLNAALTVFDKTDTLLTTNEKQRTLYPFIDFSRTVTFRDIVWECVKHKKFRLDAIYSNPDRWISYAEDARRFHRFWQSFTLHSDGRVIQITYEKLSDTDGWWYQMRRDVTGSVQDGFRCDFDSLISLNSNGALTPPNRPAFVVRLLDALPYPAALLTPRCQVIDGNDAFISIMSRGDGPAVVGGRLCIPDAPTEQAELAKRAAGFFRRRVRTPITLRVSRLDQPTPYFATLSEPPARNAGNDGPMNGILLLTLVDPDVLPTVSPRTVAELLQITGSEAEIALALCSGRSVDEIAEDRGVERRTVYNQVSSILGKTGLRNQAGIVRQVTMLCWHFGSRL
ncbi:helix-turn-helix transcriptional regulator [Azospirillum isscasi]|uniref:Helix-turn-helix transcriptional regulator n=1 Tax=Azospirillum isscasi TaxID=3053926 RepID=A0ABU0WHU6_9PROT|nr:helix-turn-helix transcriptional regulator [Azospirillum isscasi]MDQ2103417.1 helix-turn-helix transcriptional regulator [Azospirillum isscasi]